MHRVKAEFRICTRGTFKTSRGMYSTGMGNLIWSQGFEETMPGCWKVNRITPVCVPEGVTIPPQLLGRTPGAKVGNGHHWKVPNRALRDHAVTSRARGFLDRGREAVPASEVR